jgi:hypothetical protein
MFFSIASCVDYDSCTSGQLTTLSSWKLMYSIAHVHHIRILMHAIV